MRGKSGSATPTQPPLNLAVPQYHGDVTDINNVIEQTTNEVLIQLFKTAGIAMSEEDTSMADVAIRQLRNMASRNRQFKQEGTYSTDYTTFVDVNQQFHKRMQSVDILWRYESNVCAQLLELARRQVPNAFLARRPCSSTMR